MTLRPTAALALLFLCGTPALHAQDTPSGDICGTEAAEIMQQLDGVWSFKQGSGVAIGSATVPFKRMPGEYSGMVSMMLREQDPVDLELTHVPGSGFSVLTGQGQSMIMVPADAERAAEELRHQRDRLGQTDPGGGPSCASGSLPVLVGTNDHPLVGHVDPVRLEAIALDYDDGVDFIVCNSDPVPESIFDWLRSRYGSTDRVEVTADCDDQTVEQPEPLPPGTMRMTIIAEFDSATSGSGYIYYEGSMEGDNDIQFSALAPLWLSR